MRLSWEVTNQGRAERLSFQKEVREMKVHRVIYTVEVEVCFSDDEMTSKEDLRGFFSMPDCKDSWVRESVHGGNFEIVGTRIESVENA